MNEKPEIPVAVSIVLRVPSQILEHHSAASPELVGHELALSVNDHVWQNHLGYYPALDYFVDEGGIEDHLLEASCNIAWLAKELVQEEVNHRLHNVFSDIEIAQIKSTAFTMPRVRPSEINALKRLSAHYTPDAVKTTLLLHADRRQTGDSTTTAYARRMLWRWLKDHFSAMQVTSAQVV